MLRRVSKLRIFGCSLALTGLMLKLAIALFHVPSAPAFADTFDQVIPGTDFKIVYCRVHGSMKVPGTPDGGNPDDQPPNDTQIYCPLCHAIAAIDVAAPAAVYFMLPDSTALRLPGLGPHSASKYPAPLRVTARGPPIFVA